MKHTSHYALQTVASLVLLFSALFVSGQLDFFDRIQYLDKLFHITGGTVVVWFFSIYLSVGLKLFSRFKQMIILIACACLIGVFWEFAEYLSKVYSPEYLPTLYRYFHIGNLTDTLGDLLADMVGGMLFGVFYQFNRSKE